MFAKVIRVKYHPDILKDIEGWRAQGFKGDIVIYN